MSEDLWLRRTGPSSPKGRVFCFHHAGGNSAAFRTWSHPDLEFCAVELPGRGRRFGETPLERMEDLVRGLRPAVMPLLDRPFVFFGHSLGGVLAYELGRALLAAGAPLPRALVASSALLHRTATRKPVRELSDEEFLDRLRSFNGTDAAIFAEAELLELLLPILRADFEVVDSYVHTPEKLPFDVVALLGDRDGEIEPHELETWRNIAGAGFESRVFSGDHFYLRDHERAVIERIARFFDVV